MTDDQMEKFYRDLAHKKMDALWRAGGPPRSNSGLQAPYPPCHCVYGGDKVGH